MAIPDYQTLMLPLLQLAADGQEHELSESIDRLGDQFSLGPEERLELLPSGRQAVFDNRVGWARTYLKKAGLLESTARGRLRITDRGRDVLKDSPSRIDAKFLSQFPEFLEFRRSSKRIGVEEEAEEEKIETPDEMLELRYQNLRKSLAQELIQRIKESPPEVFRKACR